MDDYAFYILGLIGLYQACFEDRFLNRALELNARVIKTFRDEKNSGYYLYGSDSEQLIMRPKETYDGAIPSGNSVMAYNLDRLAKLTKDEELYALAKEQQEFMDKQASEYPSGYCFYLWATLPTRDVVCVLKKPEDLSKVKPKLNDVIRVFREPTKDFGLINDEVTFYVCQGNACLPPVNEL